MRGYLEFKAEGECTRCGEMRPLASRWSLWIEDHQSKTPSKDDRPGGICAGSRYSPRGTWKYRLVSEVDALKMAEIIAEDDGHSCLFGVYHSLNCGDRSRCNEERVRRAKALADFFLGIKKEIRAVKSR